MTGFSRYTTIFWDWSGTLINDPPLSCELLNITISKYGLPAVTVDRYRELYQHLLHLLYERVSTGFPVLNKLTELERLL